MKSGSDKTVNPVEVVNQEKAEALKHAVLESASLALSLLTGEAKGKPKKKKEEKKRKHVDEEPLIKIKEKRPKNDKSSMSFSDSNSEIEASVSKRNKSCISIDEDSENEKDEEKRLKEEKEKLEQAKGKAENEEKRKAKEERKMAKKERQRQKEIDERNRKAEDEASKRRKREAEVDAERRRKRKELIVNNDEDIRLPRKRFDCDEATFEKRRRNDSFHHPSPSTSHQVNPLHLQDADCTGKTRKDMLAEYNCISSVQAELKEFTDFLEERELLKEYGQWESSLSEMHVPEKELLTCDSEVCPFLLSYQTPLSALYQEARKKWIPPINETPSNSHLRNKCVNCDKLLSLVPDETWKKYLGANSFYCSVKCIAGKVNKVMRTNPDAETATVMNALTGETVHSGVYTRELCSFFLLSPNWMPFSAVPSQNSEALNTETLKKKERDRDKEAERQKESKSGSLSKPIPKKKPESTDALRQANRTHMENTIMSRVERMRMKGVDRKQIKLLVEQIEEMLFDKCDRNISHPKYRVWKQQFVHNFEAESAKEFVTAVVLKRLTAEKLTGLDANSLRNPLCWKIKPVGIPVQAKKKANQSRNPLDSIIGDDTRDTTAEHMSHAFSKTCKICQAKQMAEAQEKIRKQKEERELEERRERNRELREAMRQDELERQRREEESRRRKKHEEKEEWEMQKQRRRKERDEELGNDDEDYGNGSFTPAYDFESSSTINRTDTVGEKRTTQSEKPEKHKDWEFPIRIYMAEEPFDSIATPIFAQNDENRPLFRLFDRYLGEKTFNLHTPRRIQEFLIESNNAMNETRSCAFAVLKLTASGASNSYQKVLDYNLEQDTVYQLSFLVGDEILSIFLFPHRGSEILHDTFAPVTYNIGTTENCFMLIMVLRPTFAERFQYSVRVCDLEMKSQLLRIEREKLMQTSWRQPQERDENNSWRKICQPSDSPKDRKSEESNHAAEVVDAATTAPATTAVDLASKKVNFILQIVSNAKHIKDIVASAKDFMSDPDVSKADKEKISQIIEQKIQEEKSLKRAERYKLKQNPRGVSEEPSAPTDLSNGSEKSIVSHSKVDFSRPPPILARPVTGTHTAHVPMDASSSSITATVQTPLTLHNVTPMASHIIPVAAPVPIPAPFSIPPPVPPPPPTSISSQHPPFLEGLGMSDNEIVADAIRRGMVAPIPKELLQPSGPGRMRESARPALNASVPNSSSLEEDMRKLMEMEKRIEMEKRFLKEMDEIDERKFIRKSVQQPLNGTEPVEMKKEITESPIPDKAMPNIRSMPLSTQIERLSQAHHPHISAPSTSSDANFASKKRNRRNTRLKRRNTNESANHPPSDDSDDNSTSRSSSPSTPPPPPPPPPPSDINLQAPPPPPPTLTMNKAPSGVPLPVPPPPPLFSPSMICPPPPPPLPSEEKKKPVLENEHAESENDMVDGNMRTSTPPPYSPYGMPPPSLRERDEPWRGGPPPMRGAPPSLMMRGRGAPPPRGMNPSLRHGPPIRGGPPMRGSPLMRGAPPMRGTPPMRGAPPMRGSPLMFREGPPPSGRGMSSPLMRGSPMRGGIGPRGNTQGGFPPVYFNDSSRGRCPPPPRGNANMWRGGPPPTGGPPRSGGPSSSMVFPLHGGPPPSMGSQPHGGPPLGPTPVGNPAHVCPPPPMGLHPPHGGAPVGPPPHGGPPPTVGHWPSRF